MSEQKTHFYYVRDKNDRYGDRHTIGYQILGSEGGTTKVRVGVAMCHPTKDNFCKAKGRSVVQSRLKQGVASPRVRELSIPAPVPSQGSDWRVLESIITDQVFDDAEMGSCAAEREYFRTWTLDRRP